jgi:hypothetical protein
MVFEAEKREEFFSTLAHHVEFGKKKILIPGKLNITSMLIEYQTWA